MGTESPTIPRSWVQSEAQGQIKLEIKVSHLVRGQQGEGKMCLEPSEGEEGEGQGKGGEEENQEAEVKELGKYTHQCTHLDRITSSLSNYQIKKCT